MSGCESRGVPCGPLHRAAVAAADVPHSCLTPDPTDHIPPPGEAWQGSPYGLVLG